LVGIKLRPARAIYAYTAGCSFESDRANFRFGTRAISGAAMSAFKADGITVLQFSETAGGQAVYHPAHACDAAPLRRRAAARGETQGRPQVLEGNAATPRYPLAPTLHLRLNSGQQRAKVGNSSLRPW
jgi:hypothetical protein